MAEFHTKGLFEAMKASKSPPPRPATPVVLKPPAAVPPSGPRVAGIFGDAAGRKAQLATGRKVLIAVVAVVAAFGLIWGVKTLVNWQAGRTAERERPIDVAVANQPVEDGVAEHPVAAVPTVPELPVGNQPAIGRSTAGPFRIQVFSTPERNHDDMEKERRKLASGGVDTIVEHVEHRGAGSYVVFTASSFATIDGEETLAALKKIRGLGYGSAYATRKQTGNR